MAKEQSHRLRYGEIRKRNTMEKALILQNVFRELFLHKGERQIINMLSQCGHYHYGDKKRELDDDCKIMYEYLVTHNYNPYTVYKWFLLFIGKEAILEDIKI